MQIVRCHWDEQKPGNQKNGETAVAYFWLSRGLGRVTAAARPLCSLVATVVEDPLVGAFFLYAVFKT